MYELAQGQKLNERFTLLRLLGSGGMGEVWLVDDHELEDQVVAKVVPPDAPEDRVRLLRRECRHARRLVHPNIVPVYEFHPGDEVSFITMAYVEGEDLGRYRGKPPEEIIAYRKPGSHRNRRGWRVRVIPNKFPALEIEGELNKRGDGIYDMMRGVGAHEVIIESPEHLMSTSITDDGTIEANS